MSTPEKVTNYAQQLSAQYLRYLIYHPVFLLKKKGNNHNQTITFEEMDRWVDRLLSMPLLCYNIPLLQHFKKCCKTTHLSYVTVMTHLDHYCRTEYSRKEYCEIFFLSADNVTFWYDMTCFWLPFSDQYWPTLVSPPGWLSTELLIFSSFTLLFLIAWIFSWLRNSSLIVISLRWVFFFFLFFKKKKVFWH